MAAKKGEKNSEFEVTSGVTLSRTLIPTLPPNYLSRKHLFPLLDQASPSTTVVIAPAGYGKTSLVAEWAQSKKDQVIWTTLTEPDSLEEMSAIFIQATRNILPGFAPWFDQEPGIRPVENVRRWANELIATGKDFTLVIDNLRQNTARDVDIAIRLIEQFPPNLQFVTIRRDKIETVYATFSSRGPLSVIGAQDLEFSEHEISVLAKMHSVDYQDCEIRSSLDAAHGWPAAVSMMLHQIGKNKKVIDFEKLVSSETEPLRALVVSLVDNLDQKTRLFVTALSVIQEFSHEQAQVILEDDYSYDLINQIALEGSYFSQTSDPELTFEFSKLVREVLLSDLRNDKYKKLRIHAKLMEFHVYRNEPNMALEHAYLAGNLERVADIFPDAARILQATGQGLELIRWSIFAGDNSALGLLKRNTVELAGRLALMDFHGVTSLCNQMKFDAQGTELEGFIRQITHAAQAHVDIAYGRFESFENNFEIAMNPHDDPLMLGVDEQVGLLRLAASKAFILDESEKLEELLERAQSIAKSSRLPITQLQLSAMKAMSLFQSGDYRHAYEAAQIHYSQSSKRGFVGFFGPLESIFIMARCKWEFTHKKEAMLQFVQLKDFAESWKQWHWHFFADGYLARDQVVNGFAPDALERIKLARERASLLERHEGLLSIIDLSELFVRYEVRDNERAAVLLQRAPSMRFVEQIKFSLDERQGKKNIGEDVKKLPTRTPREKIWKYLAEVGEVIDSEQQAMKILKSALDIGALVGAKETFLRQSSEMGNLIMKIAAENPTVYLEELSTQVAERIKTQNNRPSEFAAALTKRELEVLRHLSTERPISAIAASLHISLNTMKTHLKNLYRKMEVDGRVSAVEKAKAHFIL